MSNSKIFPLKVRGKRKVKEVNMASVPQSFLPLPEKQVVTLKCEERWYVLLQLGIKTCDARLFKKKLYGLKEGSQIVIECLEYPEKKFLAEVTSLDTFSNVEAFLWWEFDPLPGIREVEACEKVFEAWWSEEERKDCRVVGLGLKPVALRAPGQGLVEVSNDLRTLQSLGVNMKVFPSPLSFIKENQVYFDFNLVPDLCKLVSRYLREKKDEVIRKWVSDNQYLRKVVEFEKLSKEDRFLIKSFLLKPTPEVEARMEEWAQKA